IPTHFPFSTFPLFSSSLMPRPQRSTLFPYTTLFRSPEVIARFEREAQAAASIASRYVANVFDLGDLPTGERYIVMEYLSPVGRRSEEHTSELQSRGHLVCRLLLEKKKNIHLVFSSGL